MKLCCLTLLLAGCQSEVIVTKREPVFPPGQYLSECPLDYSDRTPAGVIRTLAAGIDCERADKRAIRCWVASFDGEECNGGE